MEAGSDEFGSKKQTSPWLSYAPAKTEPLRQYLGEHVYDGFFRKVSEASHFEQGDVSTNNQGNGMQGRSDFGKLLVSSKKSK